MANKDAALSKLLTEMFDGDGAGLLRWVRLHLGKRIHDELPAGAPLGQLAFDTMLAIKRHGLASQAFASLSDERPRQAGRIQDTARLWDLAVQADGARDPAPDAIASDRLGSLWGVPELPPHYLARPTDVEQLERALLEPDGSAIGITGVSPISSPGADKHGLYGMGGIGKSVLAAAIARQQVIRERFYDGSFWIAVGQTPQLALLQVQLCRALGHAEVFDSISDGTRRLREFAADQAILLILDDVWDATHAQALDVVGRNGRMLVTTRDLEVLTWLDAREHCVDVLDPAQARALLAHWTQVAESALPPAAAEVARSCGHLPLALAMIGALVRRGRTWAEVQTWLDEAQLVRIQGKVPAYPYRNVLQAVDASVTALAAEHELSRQCYIDLAVFPEDTPIPSSALRLLWSRHGLRTADADALADTLSDRALARRDQADRVMLHDLQRLYARSQVQDLASLHGTFADAYMARCRVAHAASSQGRYAGLDDGYFFQRLPWHLAEAGRYSELADLLFDFDWLDAKLHSTGVTELLSDFELIPGEHEASREARLLRDALRLSSHVLTWDPNQLPSQIVGRLGSLGKIRSGGNHAIMRLLDQTRRTAQYMWLRPSLSNLTAPGGAEIRTLAGHDSFVLAVAVTPDGKRAISASEDRTLKLWDLDTGAEIYTFVGHGSAVCAVVVTPDGKRAISASEDRTLKLWDLDTGAEIRTFAGHADSVVAVALVANGRRAISASHDRTLRLWDLETGAEMLTLRGHVQRVAGVTVTYDDTRAVSASHDRTLKVWDLESGAEVLTLAGHDAWVWAAAVTHDDKRAVSASHDRTLKIWDLESGAEVLTLAGHNYAVQAVAVTRDDKRAVSASFDCTVKLWDLESGSEMLTLAGHSAWVAAVAMTPDSKRVLSASYDRTLKLWDLDCGARSLTLPGHDSGVQAVAVTPDGKRAISASKDRTLKLWDLDSGAEILTLSGHNSRVQAVAVTADGKRAISASRDRTLKLWDLDSGSEILTLTGHDFAVQAVAVTPDGKRAVSASDDRTLKVWDLDSGSVIRTLSGHESRVVATAVTPDGKLALSASHDRTLRLWSLVTGHEIRTLAGHDDRVVAVAATSDSMRALSASKDKTLKVWDLDTGAVILTIAGHTEVTAVAVTPDGKRAVSASHDRTLKLWDLGSGTLLATFTGDGAITACDVAPTGHLFVAGDALGRVHVLELIEPATK